MTQHDVTRREHACHWSSIVCSTPRVRQHSFCWLCGFVARARSDEGRLRFPGSQTLLLDSGIGQCVSRYENSQTFFGCEQRWRRCVDIKRKRCLCLLLIDGVCTNDNLFWSQIDDDGRQCKGRMHSLVYATSMGGPSSWCYRVGSCGNKGI